MIYVNANSYLNQFYFLSFLLSSSFFFFLLFPSSHCWNVFVSCNLFLKNIPTWKKIKLILFSDFILHTFRKFKFQFYNSTKRHTFSFWPSYIRYTLLIIDKLTVELSLLMPLLHLSVYGISSQFCFLYIFITNIRYFISFLVFFLSGITWNCCKFM